MISPPTISCASFGPDWKREPIADPKYELISIVLRVLLFLCSLSRARCSSCKSRRRVEQKGVEENFASEILGFHTLITR